MSQILIIKLDSRRSKSDELENKIVQSLESIGIKYDGSDLEFGTEFNRGLYFISKKNLKLEIIEVEDEDDEDEDEEDEDEEDEDEDEDEDEIYFRNI